MNSSAPASPTSHIPRLLALAWQYRLGCVTVLGLQVALLVLGLTAVVLSGLAIDVVRAAVESGAPPPHWPWGLQPPLYASSLSIVVLIGIAILAAAMVRALLTYAFTVSVGHLVQVQIVPTLREAVYGKLQRLSFRFFDATASGSIINRVTSDVQNVRAFVDQVLIQGLVMILALLVSVGYMVGRHPALTLACVGSTPLLWILTRTFSRRVRPAYEESRNRLDLLINALAETVQGMPVVKGFGRELERSAHLKHLNDNLQAQQSTVFRRVATFTPAIDFIGQWNLAVLLGYGGYLVITARLSLGDVVVFAALLQQYSTQISNLANIVNSLQQSLVSAGRVFEILDTPVAIQSPQHATTPTPFHASLRFNHVSFGYRDQEPELHDIDIAVEAGQRAVLFGTTGCGKSTLLGLIPRFHDPDHGAVLLSGVDVRALDLIDLRARIGVVFQESVLFSTTVADNIAFGRPSASMEAIERAARQAAAHDFIMAMPEGYDTILDEGGNNLSGGQRQRLAIARALLPDPPILLLDDPTASVDMETEAAILASIDAAAVNRTTLLATHRVSACRKADVIVVLDQGRIVEQGTHEDLVRAGGRYAAAVRLQERLDGQSEAPT